MTPSTSVYIASSSNQSRTLSPLLFPSLLAVFLFCFTPLAPGTLVYVIDMAGSLTVDESDDPVFGLTGTHGFSLQLVYDPALNTNTNVVLEGEEFGSSNSFAGNDFFGYSASGVLSLNATFGSVELPLEGALLSERFPAPGISADIWMDTDITQSTPALMDLMLFFDEPNLVGTLQIGGLDENAQSEVVVFNELWIEDDDTRGSAEGQWTSLDMTVIPEPSSFGLLLAGLAALCAMRRRRKA